MAEDSSSDNDRWPTQTIIDEIRSAYVDDADLREFWEPEEAGVIAAVHAIGPKLPPDRYRYKGVLGVGGSGIVLKLGDDIFVHLDSALKFPRPVYGKISLVADMLAKEMAFLADCGIRELFAYFITGKSTKLTFTEPCRSI